MRLTFKQFLFEGGAATAKYNVSRATKSDIETAIQQVGQALGLSDIADRLLGSTTLTLAGHREDSGDIDIVVTRDDIDPEQAHQKMMELTNQEGTFNKGTNIGSYALPVGDKKIQVDLMFVNSKEWAKFIYAASKDSQYPGAVRNILLACAVRHTHEAGKDFLIKKGDTVLARASRALKLDTGLERLFKMANKKKDGTFGSAMDKIDPKELQVQANALAGREVKFSHDAEILDSPDAVAAWIFGQGTTAQDIQTAEQVVEKIKTLKTADLVIADAKEALKKANLPIPDTL